MHGFKRLREVVRVACQLRSWFVNYATDKRRERLCKRYKPCKRETTARRVSPYSCGLCVLGAQDLAVCNFHSLNVSTVFWVLSHLWFIILNLIYRTVLIFILIYSEWRYTENQRYVIGTRREKMVSYFFFSGLRPRLSTLAVACSNFNLVPRAFP